MCNLKRNQNRQQSVNPTLRQNRVSEIGKKTPTDVGQNAPTRDMLTKLGKYIPCSQCFISHFTLNTLKFCVAKLSYWFGARYILNSSPVCLDIHLWSLKTASLTVIRPAGVEHIASIRSEADVQHAPAHVTRLHCPLQVEAPPGGVVQADILVYKTNSIYLRC